MARRKSEAELLSIRILPNKKRLKIKFNKKKVSITKDKTALFVDLK